MQIEIAFSDLCLCQDACFQSARYFAKESMRLRKGRTHKRHTEISRISLRWARQFGMAGKRIRALLHADYERIMAEAKKNPSPGCPSEGEDSKAGEPSGSQPHHALIA